MLLQLTYPLPQDTFTNNFLRYLLLLVWEELNQSAQVINLGRRSTDDPEHFEPILSAEYLTYQHLDLPPSRADLTRNPPTISLEVFQFRQPIGPRSMHHPLGKTITEDHRTSTTRSIDLIFRY